MLSYMEFLGVPATITIGFVVVFLIIQIIGELLEFKGKVVPEFFKIRKYFARRKKDREKMDKIFESVKELEKISKSNDEHMRKLDKKVDKLDEEMVSMRIDNMRNEIIRFAANVEDKNAPVTRERFNRVFKMHQEYEDLIKKNGRTNGEVDIAYRIITESYEEHTRNHTFVEDIRGWK